MNNKSLPPVGKYIDPLADFAFKKIFGTEPNKDLLIAFINAVFRSRKQIVDVVFNKNEHPGELRDEGGVIFAHYQPGAQGKSCCMGISDIGNIPDRLIRGFYFGGI